MGLVVNKLERLRRIQKLHKIASSFKNILENNSSIPSLPSGQTDFSMPKRKTLAERVPLPRATKDPLEAAIEAAERESKSKEIEEVIYPPMLIGGKLTPLPSTKTHHKTKSKKSSPPPLTPFEWDTPIVDPHSFPKKPIENKTDPEWMDAPDLDEWTPDWMNAPELTEKKSSRKYRLQKLAQLSKY